MTARDLKYAKLEAHGAYPGLWKTDLMGGPCTDLPFCCLSVFCPCCVSYHLRRRALRGDMTRYICCNGDWPCSGRCSEQSCPEACLATETVCCFAQSVASTRWMLQDEMHLRNTKCDNCIIGTMIAAQYLACCCSIAACLTSNDALADLANLTDLVADVLWISVCACLQTQHKVQLDERDRNPSIVVGSPFQAPIPQAMTQQAAPAWGQAQPPPQQYAYPPPPQYPYPQPGYPSPPQQYPPPHGWQQ